MVGSPERTEQLYARTLPTDWERAEKRKDTCIDYRILITVFPWFLPSSIPINVFGAFASPVVVSSMNLICPSFTNGATSAKKVEK